MKTSKNQSTPLKRDTTMKKQLNKTNTKYLTRSRASTQAINTKQTQKTNPEAQKQTQKTTPEAQIIMVNDPINISADHTIRQQNLIDEDTRYLTQLLKKLKLNCKIFENKETNQRLYHFDNRVDCQSFYDNVNIQILSEECYIEIYNDPQPNENTSDITPEHSYTTTHTEIAHNSSIEGAFSSDSEEGEIKESPIHTNSNTLSHPQQNVVRILNHINKGGNPIYLKSICKTQKAPFPITQFYGHKTKISTLIFDSKHDANRFINTINPINFGPKAKYEVSQTKKTCSIHCQRT